MNKKIKIALSCLSLLLVIIGMSACTTQDELTLTNLLSTRPTQQSGDIVITSSSMMDPFSFETNVKNSDAAVIGKVVEILPSKIDNIKLFSTEIIYTVVIIEVERWLYGQFESKLIAIRVEEGRVDNKIMIGENEPVFILGEVCLLILENPSYHGDIPVGFNVTDYFVVFDGKWGKYIIESEKLIDWQGKQQVISNFEQTIAEIRMVN